jgi:hypothetical protein
MSMTGSNSATARLRDLERTVNALNGQLRDMQSELQQQSKGASMTERLWGNVIGSRQSHMYMSAVCNRRVRPNIKVTHDATVAS